jgi:cytochrome b561
MVKVRYSGIAILLHWLIAVLLIGQVLLGWTLESYSSENPTHRLLIGYHKPLGLTILVLSLIRLAWRLTHRPPPYPAQIRGAGLTLAKTVHVLFYVMLLALPLSGWIMVSANAKYPISYFGLFNWPYFPGVHGLSVASQKHLHDMIEVWHKSILVWTTLVLIALHLAGVARHQLHKYPLIKRMLPGEGAPL